MLDLENKMQVHNTITKGWILCLYFKLVQVYYWPLFQKFVWQISEQNRQTSDAIISANSGAKPDIAGNVQTCSKIVNIEKLVTIRQIINQSNFQNCTVLNFNTIAFF